MSQAAIRTRKSPRIITNLRPERLSGRLEEWQPTCLSYSWRGTMHLHRTRVFDGQEVTAQDNSEITGRRQSAGKLRAIAALMLTMASCMPSGMAAQTPAGTNGPDKAASDLPSAPAPIPTEPFALNRSARDFTKPYAGFLSNPINKFRPTNIEKASFANSVRLSDMVKDGKIYLSLSDAIALALENNYDIAISRYYLDIADLDLLRAKAGSGLRGVGATVVNNTLGGTSTTLSSSGAPGGASGATTGSSGVTLTTDGAGPAPENLDPVLGGTVQLERAESPRSEER